MPAITLYVKESDAELIERAKKKLGDSLSAAFVDCLRQRMSTRYRKITLSTWDNKGKPNIKQTFRGRWLIGNENEGVATRDRMKYRGAEFSIAVSEKGHFVVYVQHPQGEWGPFPMTFHSFEDMRKASGEGGRTAVPDDIIEQVTEALAHAGEIKLDV
jgi:hypothetical protein